MLFKDIPGLTDTKNILINSVKKDHIAHGQLFFGAQGSAALALAIAYATYVNCENKKEDDACGECAACVKNKKLIFPDLHFVFPTSTTKEKTKDVSSATFMKEWRAFVQENPYAIMTDWGSYFGGENKQLSISVDESRNIIKTLTLKSFEGEYKILILWLPEMMNASSANALLKILEEPPVKTLFLLVTQDAEKIITTILSRTQMVKIRSFTDEEISEQLQTKKGLEEKKAKQIAYLADGNMNEAYRLVNEIEEDNQEMFREWMRLCYKRDYIELVNWTDTFQKLGREAQKSYFQYGLNMLRETLVYRHAGNSLLRLQEHERDFIDKFSKVLDDTKVEIISKSLNEAYYHIERNANPKILFLDLSLTISGLIR